MESVLATGALQQKVGGKEVQQKAYVVELLKEKHVEQIMGLQATIMQNLRDPDLMEPISYDFMVEHIERQGFILGVFADRRLIAFRIVYFPHSQDKEFNMAIDLGFAENQRSRVANLQMVCVHPEFRGNALASKLNRLAMRLLRRHYACEHVFATVSPYNVWNVRILLNSGFRIAALKYKYGGKLRYIVYQKLHSPLTFVDGKILYAPLEDLDAQKRFFKSGHYGIALAQKQSPGNDFNSKPPRHNYILFKKPPGRRAIPSVANSPHADENVLSLDAGLGQTEKSFAGRWNIYGDQSFTVDRAFLFRSGFNVASRPLM